MHTWQAPKTARANKNEVGFSYDKIKLPICMAREKNNKLDQNPHIFGMVCYGRTLGLGECAPPTIVAVGDFFRALLSSIIERKATTDTY